MTSCSFCGSEVTPGTGKMYIKRDGTVWHFCKSKCQRNQIGLRRVNRHVGWTRAYGEHKGDRLSEQAARVAEAAAKTPRASKAAAASAKAAKTEPKAEAKATVKASAKTAKASAK
jgi:large subunit ribosomal protein L24e